MDEQSSVNETLEDNLPMVNYIMLHRIYDLLTIIANDIDAEKTAKMIEYHTAGFLIGPGPSYTPATEE